jgi:UPF0716 protein FxsA
MFVVLVLLFVVAPIAELYVILQVTHSIGIPETILLLIAISFVGAWLARVAGFSVLNRLQRTVRAGKVPSSELVDGALVLLAGALMITPGFLSDALAILLLLPPSRAVVRNVVLRRLRAGDGIFRVGTVRQGQPGAGPPGDFDVWDVEGWEDPPDRPGLGR